jgi:uncharacterized protein YlxW (UPF0749 family)
MDISRYTKKTATTTSRIPKGSLLGLFAMAIVIATIAVSTLRLSEKRSLVKSLRNQARQEYTQLESSYDHVQKTIDDVSTVEGRERAIRENLRAVKEGEEIVVLVPEKS